MCRAGGTGVRAKHRLRASLSVVVAVTVAAGALACSESGEVAKSSAQERAARRAYDGAPPVIPHLGFSRACTECHGERGVEVAGVGFSPPSPHEATPGLSDMSHCLQCHVEQRTEEVWRQSTFAGLPQDLRSGRRLNPLAPPVRPHPELMRENCLACHSGPAARKEIRTDHPERRQCIQCHVAQRTTTVFGSSS